MAKKLVRLKRDESAAECIRRYNLNYGEKVSLVYPDGKRRRICSAVVGMAEGYPVYDDRGRMHPFQWVCFLRSDGREISYGY